MTRVSPELPSAGICCDVSVRRKAASPAGGEHAEDPAAGAEELQECPAALLLAFRHADE